MQKGFRVLLGLIILALSLTLLIWSLLPATRHSLVLPIPPGDLTLPTP